MIKIGFVVPSSIEYIGGMEKTIKRYLSYDSDKVQKTLIQFENKGTYENTIVLKSVYSKLNIGTSGFLNFAVRILAPFILSIDILMNIKKLKFIKENIDMIYLANNDFYFLFKKHKNIIWSEHGNLFHNYTGVNYLNRIIYKMVEKNILFKNIKTVHLLNCYNKKFIPDRIKTFCVPNGIDSDKFIPKMNKNSVAKCLFVGRLEKSKGIQAIINAFNMLDKRYDLSVVGKGPLSEPVKKNTGDRLHYYGYIDDSKLIDLYGSSDVFIFPSTLENYGNVILEALSSGLYILASSTLRPRFDFAEKMNYLEYISPEENGILKSLENINKKIEYSSNYDNKLKMHEYIKQEYDWKLILNDLYSHLSGNLE